MPSEVRRAFMAIKRVYERMVAQGMSREAIEAEIRTWMHRAMEHAGESMPDEQVDYYLKLTLCLLAITTPAQAKRLADLVRRSHESN
jgi:hypothetical protein